MKVAASASASAAAAPAHGGGGGGGDPHAHDDDDDAAAPAGRDRRTQQPRLLKRGALRSSSNNADDPASSSVSSPLTLSLLGRALGGARRMFAEPPSWLPLLVLLHNQFIFAGMHVVAKPALHYIPPFALAMMRVRVPCDWPDRRKQGGNEGPRIPPPHLPHILGAAHQPTPPE